MDSSTVDTSRRVCGSQPSKSHSPSPRASDSSDCEKPTRLGIEVSKSASDLSGYAVPLLSDYLASQLPSHTNSDAVKPTSDSCVGRKQKNRQRVLDAIEKADCTQVQLQQQLNLGAATVSRWLTDLLDSKRIHICRLEQNPHGGPQTLVYRFGAKPKGRPSKKPRKLSDLERTRLYRKRMRDSGEWEHTLAKRRATYRADKPRRDPLTAALFGAV